MSEKLNNLLNKLGAEVLSEDAKAQIIKQFEDLIAEKAQIHVKNAKEKLDAEHSQLLEKLLANIEKGEVFAKEDKKTVWKCRNCGFIFVGDKAPKMCPCCNHPQAYFELYTKNY